MRREATCADDGEWVLVLRYTDKATATKAGRNDTSELAHSFMSQINMSSMSAGFYEIVSK